MRGCHLLGDFHGKYVQIVGLTAPGNYSDQFWSNKNLVLLCEGPKPKMFIYSGFLNPWSFVFMDLNMPKYFTQYIKKVWNEF